MKLIKKSDKTRVWAAIITSSTVLLILLSYVFISTVISVAYDWPTSATKKARVALNNGLSPNGVIEEAQSRKSLDDFYNVEELQVGEFIYIQEFSSSYKTSTNNFDSSSYKLPDEFIKNTKEDGESRTKILLPDGKYAVQSFTYNYGSVSGFVAIGRRANVDDNLIYQYTLYAVLSWVVVSTGSYLLLKDKSIKK